MKKLLSICGLSAALLCAAIQARATLFVRGNGLIHDSFDNLSWTRGGSLPGYGNCDKQLGFCGEPGVHRL